MLLFALGVSHRTAHVEQRERVSLSSGRACSLLQELASDDRVGEVVALSTCNRTEMYATVRSPEEGKAALTSAVVHATEVRPAELEEISYVLTGTAVARHLIRVAASLDSMVIGESEIQGQVRAALHLAEAHGTAGAQLRDLFRRALIVGKRVRRETAIGRGVVSFSSVAVELAREALPDLEDRNTVLVGAGHIAEATAGALAATGARLRTVANRSLLAAQELAERFGGRGIPLEALGEELQCADIVICSTESPRPILTVADVQAALVARPDRPLVLIDIAVPRDVAPEVRHLPGVLLRDIDDLERVAQANLSDRLREARRAEGIVAQELRRFAARESPRAVSVVAPALL
jgi:glutamyl-tRNA reductase